LLRRPTPSWPWQWPPHEVAAAAAQSLALASTAALLGVGMLHPPSARPHLPPELRFPWGAGRFGPGPGPEWGGPATSESWQGRPDWGAGRVGFGDQKASWSIFAQAAAAAAGYAAGTTAATTTTTAGVSTDLEPGALADQAVTAIVPRVLVPFPGQSKP
jgi:hypothetical protein